MLEQPENLVVPQCENPQVRSISREVELAWLAGIYDGEGALSLDLKMASNGKNYLTPKVRVYNTDVRMIQKVSQIYKDLGVVFFYNVNLKRAAHYKNQIGICVTSQGSCLKVLEAVEPYLANKRDHARAMICVIAYVQGLPKGGNTSSYNYAEDLEFQSYMLMWQGAKDLHIDPSTTTREAGHVLAW